MRFLSLWFYHRRRAVLIVVNSHPHRAFREVDRRRRKRGDRTLLGHAVAPSLPHQRPPLLRRQHLLIREVKIVSVLAARDGVERRAQPRVAARIDRRRWRRSGSWSTPSRDGVAQGLDARRGRARERRLPAARRRVRLARAARHNVHGRIKAQLEAKVDERQEGQENERNHDAEEHVDHTTQLDLPCANAEE